MPIAPMAKMEVESLSRYLVSLAGVALATALAVSSFAYSLHIRELDEQRAAIALADLRGTLSAWGFSTSDLSYTSQTDTSGTSVYLYLVQPIEVTGVC